jgi:hypothetical protein
LRLFVLDLVGLEGGGVVLEGIRSSGGTGVHGDIKKASDSSDSLGTECNRTKTMMCGTFEFLGMEGLAGILCDRIASKHSYADALYEGALFHQ